MDCNTPKKILVLPSEPQYGVIIESPKTIHNSLFYDVYKKAAGCVKSILKCSAKGKGEFPQETFLNTVISFTGERGSGKSSAMLSFAKLLKESASADIWNKVDKEILGNNFWVLPAIDSTQMGQNERLLASVSGKMYKEYEKKCVRGVLPNNITIDQKRHFLTLEQKVNQLSFMFNRGDWYSDESDLLQNVTELGNIRNTIQTLIDEFLTIMFGRCDEHTYLVISIDDLDMNLENSFEIVDEIRKFLTLRHVIVLTSVCIEQLKELVEQHFDKPFIKSYNRSSNTGEVLAQKYIEKVFPISRQMEMPALSYEELQRKHIANLLGDQEKGATTRFDLGLRDVDGIQNQPVTILEGVLHMIYRKTMLLLVPEENGRHWIVPTNLRELCNFIYFLREMDDVVFEKAEDTEPTKYNLRTDSKLAEPEVLDAMEKNLRRLMQYIVSNLLDYNTTGMSPDTKGMAEVLTRLLRDMPEWTLVTMNKKIIRDILVYVAGSELYRGFYTHEQLETLLDATRYVHVISMGDVLHVLGELSMRSNDYTIKRFVEYVRVIWSIRMTIEFYCVGVRYNKIKPELYHTPIRDKTNGCVEGGYITTQFRDVVGGMIVTPESAHLFDFSNIKETATLSFPENDWIKVSISSDSAYLKNATSALGLIGVFGVNKEQNTQTSSEDNQNETGTQNSKSQGIYTWRTLSEKPFYKKKCFVECGKDIYFHYMALFTNLLDASFPIQKRYPTARQIESEPNVFDEWRGKYRMVMPFYSMDWIHRFYMEIKKNSEMKLQISMKKQIDDFNAYVKNAYVELQRLSAKYIELAPRPNPAADAGESSSSYILSGQLYEYRFDELVLIREISNIGRELDQILTLRSPRRRPYRTDEEHPTNALNRSDW